MVLAYLPCKLVIEIQLWLLKSSERENMLIAHIYTEFQISRVCRVNSRIIFSYVKHRL